jgi:1,4-alpha-glucan branching enzyme
MSESIAPILEDAGLRAHAEGRHWRAYEMLGAHPSTIAGVSGTRFAVWAPDAARVSVVGDFNGWDGRRHPMRARRDSGVWETFVPAVGRAQLYKYEIETRGGGVLIKADPFAFRAEIPPRTASIVHGLPERVDPGPSGQTFDRRRAPMTIYEVHLPSWRRRAVEGARSLSYRELADELVPYVLEMGFTHIELMPIAEHPFGGSWGYQPTGLFAPTSRLGTPDDFRAFVERCHGAGIEVILDWVPGHFPMDDHGLALFDGEHLYEHADPREGRHPDWGTLIYNHGRREVRSFLISNALFWLERYGVDGLRVDAVASMLYRNYSRKRGQWRPNRHGGIENLEAIEFLKQLNEAVYSERPTAFTIAEESTAWPRVSRPTYDGGLGFGFKWNMGWMHDTLAYMSRDPIHRRHHHHELTFGLLYAFSENFILPLSHDEVVHGKGSLLSKMPGDRWRKFANLRAYFAFMYTQPGKKLLFMGGEFAQEREWDHDGSLDWGLLEDPMHAGVQALVRDLNMLHRQWPVLHELDCEPRGFAWIIGDDRDNSAFAYLRRGADPDDVAVVVCNFTPVVRQGYRVGVPAPGRYVERLNTDSRHYGGADVGNLGAIEARAVPAHGFAYSVSLTLPPLAVLVLQPCSG